MPHPAPVTAAARTAKGDASRQRLLDAATEQLLARDGHLDVGSVSRAAGLAPSVLYHYFGSKAGLVGAVVAGFYARLSAEVLSVDLRDLGDWRARERERVRRGVEFHFREPLSAVIYGRLSRDPEIAALEAEHVTAVVAASARNIAAAQRAGELPRAADPALAGAAIFGALRQVLVEALGRRRRPSRAVVVEHMWRVTAAAVSISPEGTS
jgi:AcrR family transcriptional regulator